MIKKEKCKKCNKPVKSSYNFCPNCGNNLTKGDWGMLGKNDFIEEDPQSFLEKMGSGIINKMIGGTIKMLEKEIQKELKNNIPPTKMRLMINGKEIMPVQKKENTKMLPIEFDLENLEKWKKLKKVEPKTELKRIGNNITYILNTPGVKSIKDISIIKLENSIELKAVAEKNGYKKTIPIDLDLKKFSLINEKIILEMDA
jgi:hypothetical protein